MAFQFQLQHEDYVHTLNCLSYFQNILLLEYPSSPKDTGWVVIKIPPLDTLSQIAKVAIVYGCI